MIVSFLYPQMTPHFYLWCCTLAKSKFHALSCTGSSEWMWEFCVFWKEAIAIIKYLIHHVSKMSLISFFWVTHIQPLSSFSQKVQKSKSQVTVLMYILENLKDILLTKHYAMWSRQRNGTYTVKWTRISNYPAVSCYTVLDWHTFVLEFTQKM